MPHHHLLHLSREYQRHEYFTHWKKFCRITARKSATDNKPPQHKHRNNMQ